jgi:hypothetical protein
MTLTDLTLGNDKLKSEAFDIPMINMVTLRAASLESIYNFLLGTSSDVWLKDAENNVK